ncbi:hypothetical protein FQA39_LY09608 [Lamprigera yunnana]|nr:hypothetical protein FQA39_LY09608 [Lamprigera yunnana]
MTSTTTIRKSYGNRKLYTFPEDYPLRFVKSKSSSAGSNAPKKSEDVAKLLKYIDDNIVGKHNAFLGPFGRRKVVFCDYVSSGRSLQFIEEYILREVLPCFGNTWSTANITSIQTSLFRQEAREIIKNAVNATEEDSVIFTDNGCVGAVQKIINSLDLIESPIVFIGYNEDYEHLKLWQESGATVIKIAETIDGFLDLNDLEEQLRMHCNSGKQLIGIFSIVSNITGILADDVATTILLHQYRALAFWDYNFAAPNVVIDLNPHVTGVKETSIRKDATYFSLHKFAGGVQTPGVLIMKRALFKEEDGINNGFFELRNQNKCFELHEEVDSTQVVESIRAGLVMQLKETVTGSIITQRLEKITKQMMQHIRTIPEVTLLGNKSSSLKRLPIFSFLVRHPRGTFLHHNFVCAVLNDIFGIQARAGCANSSSYTQDLLGIDSNLAEQYENIILEDLTLHLSMQNSALQLLRPGFTRISLPYFISDSELAFIMEAIKMVATEGWKLLPQYVVDLETNEWRHYSNSVSKDRKWLGSIRYIDGKMTMNERRISGPGLFPQNYSDCLQTARNLFNRARKTANRNPYPNQGIHFDLKGEQLRWFMLPQEAQELLTTNSQNVKHSLPFDPVRYTGSKRTNREQKYSAPSSGGLQTRHYSLPIIDDNTNGSVSPLPYYVTEYQNVNRPPHFAVGETVSSTIFHPVPNTYHRERCMSLGDSALPPPPLLSPQTSASLGITNLRRRNCSCSSQTDIHSLDSDFNLSPAQSLNVLYTSWSELARASPAPPATDLHAYVSEISKELATSIKYEIREVINKVEDVLENTDNTDGGSKYFSSDKYGSGSEDGRSDSISANEVAEYLEKVSREMANEVKSEIRDVVSAVDVFITPEGQERNTFSRTSSMGDSDRLNSSQRNIAGTSNESSDMTVNKLCSSSKLSDEEHSDKSSKSKIHTSISSQDSGINLSFQEQDCLNQDLKRAIKTELRLENDRKTESLPKTIWQPAVEAIREFQMIRDGDKVMVCLSGRKDSLSLLHTLIQYQTYIQNEGILFNLGAITINPDSMGCDPCILIPHLKQMGVNYVVEDHNDVNCEVEQFEQAKENLYSFCTPEKRRRLYTTARSCGYNVLAIGQHLDDLCESFVLSIFHSGKIKSMNAHYYIREHDLRIIRPLIYVREKAIKQFIISHKLPVNLESNQFDNTTKQRQRAKQMLAQQEILFPKLFDNIKSAMSTIIGFHVASNKGNKCAKCSQGVDELSEGETDEETFLLKK